jgi:hypothetical protein
MRAGPPEKRKLCVFFFSQMGRDGCRPDYAHRLLGEIESAFKIQYVVKTKCFQAPDVWMPYATEDEDEVRVGTPTEIESHLDALSRGHADQPWERIQDEVDAGAQFIFIGASNGCIPAGFFAHYYHRSTLGLMFLSGVPGREQWAGLNAVDYPIVLTCGTRERFFGGSRILYKFAQIVRASVINFSGGHLEEEHHIHRAAARLLHRLAVGGVPHGKKTFFPLKRKR